MYKCKYAAINSFRQLFPDKIFSLTFPRFLVKSLTFLWQLLNSLTFPGFPDKWSPCMLPHSNPPHGRYSGCKQNQKICSSRHSKHSCPAHELEKCGFYLSKSNCMQIKPYVAELRPNTTLVFSHTSPWPDLLTSKLQWSNKGNTVEHLAVELRRKNGFSILDVVHSTCKMQCKDRGTSEEHFGLYLR